MVKSGKKGKKTTKKPVASKQKKLTKPSSPLKQKKEIKKGGKKDKQKKIQVKKGATKVKEKEGKKEPKITKVKEKKVQPESREEKKIQPALGKTTPAEEQIPEKIETKEQIQEKQAEKTEEKELTSVQKPKSLYETISEGLPGLPLKPHQKVEPLKEDEKKTLEEILTRYNYDPVYILAILQDIQDKMNYIPRPWVEELSVKLKVPKTKIYRIATFFKALSLEPRGKHICTICVGTTCHVRGAPKLIDKVERDYGIKAGETTQDGNLTFETVGCVGACALGPLVVMDGKYHGHMTTDTLGKLLKKTIQKSTE